jgi:hypothetical protein
VTTVVAGLSHALNVSAAASVVKIIEYFMFLFLGG